MGIDKTIFSTNNSSHLNGKLRGSRSGTSDLWGFLASSYDMKLRFVWRHFSAKEIKAQRAPLSSVPFTINEASGNTWMNVIWEGSFNETTLNGFHLSFLSWWHLTHFASTARLTWQSDFSGWSRLLAPPSGMAPHGKLIKTMILSHTHNLFVVSPRPTLTKGVYHWTSVLLNAVSKIL